MHPLRLATCGRATLNASVEGKTNPTLPSITTSVSTANKSNHEINDSTILQILEYIGG